MRASRVAAAAAKETWICAAIAMPMALEAVLADVVGARACTNAGAEVATSIAKTEVATALANATAPAAVDRSRHCAHSGTHCGDDRCSAASVGPETALDPPWLRRRLCPLALSFLFF